MLVLFVLGPYVIGGCCLAAMVVAIKRPRPETWAIDLANVAESEVVRRLGAGNGVGHFVGVVTSLEPLTIADDSGVGAVSGSYAVFADGFASGPATRLLVGTRVGVLGRARERPRGPTYRTSGLPTVDIVPVDDQVFVFLDSVRDYLDASRAKRDSAHRARKRLLIGIAVVVGCFLLLVAAAWNAVIC